MAVFSVPATEAASERVFKTAKRTLRDDRTHLHHARAEAQVVVGRLLTVRGYDLKDPQTVCEVARLLK